MSEQKPTLTPRKSAFFDKVQEKKSEKPNIAPQEVGAIARYYQEKYDIDIIVNGTTEYGKKLLAQEGTYTIDKKTHTGNRKDNQRGGLTHSEMVEEVRHIQTSLKEGQRVGYIYTNQFLHYQSSPNSNVHTECLIISKDSIVRPSSFRYPPDKKLKELDEYIFPEHFPGVPFYEGDLRDLIPSFKVLEEETSDDYYTTTWYGPCPPKPQADLTSCTTLNLKYLKELLKNDGSELRDFTLNIPYYKNNQLRYFFLPSPQVLLYSQSEKYNEAIAGILSSEQDTIEVECLEVGSKQSLYNPPGMNVQGVSRHKNHPLKTLRGILKETSDTALSRGDNATVQLCAELQKRLPEFQKTWMAENQRVKAKRELMRDKQHNHHLSYANHQLKGKVTSAEHVEGSIFDLPTAVITKEIKETKLIKQQLDKPDSTMVPKEKENSRIETPPKSPVPTDLPADFKESKDSEDSKSPYRVRLLLDYDHCCDILFYESYPEEYYKNLYNKEFEEVNNPPDFKEWKANTFKEYKTKAEQLEAYLKQITAGADEVVVGIFSVRQSHTREKDNTKDNQTGSCFKNFEDLCKKNGWRYFKLLLADVANNQKPGTYMDAKPPEKAKEFSPTQYALKNIYMHIYDKGYSRQDSSVTGDSIKALILQAQLNYASKDLQENIQNIKQEYCYVIDDDFSMLNTLESLIKDKTITIPPGVTLRRVCYITAPKKSSVGEDYTEYSTPPSPPTENDAKKHSPAPSIEQDPQKTKSSLCLDIYGFFKSNPGITKVVLFSALELVSLGIVYGVSLTNNNVHNFMSATPGKIAGGIGDKLATPLTPFLGAFLVCLICVYFYERSKTKKTAQVDDEPTNIRPSQEV